MIHPVVVNPVLSPLVGILNPSRWRAGRNAPLDSILHWDADIDAFSEQTGGAHTFNHSVLSPQYQLGADGSYTDVGAKPAVDVFDGKRWLRSCGVVTNLLPSGSEDFLASVGWTNTHNLTNNPTTIGSVPSRRLTVIYTGSAAYIGRFQSSFDSAPFFSVLVKKGNCDWVYFGFYTSEDNGLWFNLATGVVGSAIGTATGSIEALGGGVFRLHIWSSTVYKNFIVTPPRPCNGDDVLAVTAGQYVDVAQFQLTATSYPVPYVPPGVTQPASNATATNGSWFALPDGSPLWQALDGQADGVELVTNGGFDSDISNWSSGSANTTIYFDAGQCRSFRNGTSAANASLLSQVKDSATGSFLVSFDAYSSNSSTKLRASFSTSNTPGSGVVSTANITQVKKRYTVVLSKLATELIFLISAENAVLRDIFYFDNISIQRIQPQPLTLATRVRMGVGSADLPAGGFGDVVSCIAMVFGLQYFEKTFSGSEYIIRAYDRSSVSGFSIASWPRNVIVNRVTQVNTAGTQFRVGYMIEGTHTAIQWSAWANFDGSMNPSTLYRLMLGYNNAYPMWFSRITAWKEQVSDARILEALNG